MKELKELVKFSVSLGNAVDKSLADKKLDLSDLPLFIEAFMQAPEAFSGVDKIKSEWHNSSSEQKQLLVKEIEQELNLASEKTEKIIESSIKIVVEILEVVSEIKK